MARPIRIQFPGGVYHVTARGNERRAIFRDDTDRRCFLETVGKMVRDHSLFLHAYCLMPNHYHMVIETPRANLATAIGWLQTTYSIRFNRRHKRCGHLFQGRYKAHLVDKDAHALTLVKYIHLNPVRNSQDRPLSLEARKTLAEYPWSSHRAYAGDNRSAPAWLCLEWLSYFGPTPSAAQAEYGRQVDQMFGRVVRSPWTELRHGLVLGGEDLWEKVRAHVSQSMRKEEIRLVRKAEADDASRSRLIASLVEKENDRRMAIWIRVKLGGERMTAVAADYGYADGSAVSQVIRRLEKKARTDSNLARRFSEIMSSVKS